MFGPTPRFCYLGLEISTVKDSVSP